MKKILWRIACAALVAAPALAQAQELPRTIRIVVQFPPGGPADFTPRLIAEKVSASTGSTVLIENKPGGAGLIGVRAVLNGPKDGSNLLMCPNTIALLPQIYRTSPYQLSDFTPVSMMARNPFVLVVANSFPAETMKEFVDEVKRRPGEFRFGSLGPANTVDLFTQYFLRQQELSMKAIPYKGLAPAELALRTGEIHLLMNPIGPALQLQRTGQAKILGVATEQRVASAPEIPTLKEQGFDFIGESWLGICAPSGVPKPIVDALSEEIQKAVAAPDVQEKLKALESIPTSTTPEEFSTMLESTSAEWGRIIKALGVQLDAP